MMRIVTLVCALALIQPAVSLGYEPGTHDVLTEISVQISTLRADAALLPSLGLKAFENGQEFTNSL